MSPARLQVSRRIRATAYTQRIEALGVSEYSVVNRTILPKGFDKTVEEDYWHLKTQVQLWDVGCQRQVELSGTDAARLAQLMTPRDLRAAQVGQCLYVPVIDHNAGMLNDPVLLKIADDRFWFSIADADLLLWAQGLAVGLGLDVEINEPDVWPLAVQGPKADDLMVRVFGEQVREIGFFKFKCFPFHGQSLVIARSGFSRQGGFEIYLPDFSLGEQLWDALWLAGVDLGVAPGCPNLIERIEAGLLSYGNEMTRADNPLQCGLERFCQLDGSLDYIGKSALLALKHQTLDRRITGLVFAGEPGPAVQIPWPISSAATPIGYITSAAWSPRCRQNVALAMLDRGYWDAGCEVVVHCGDGSERRGLISDLPMT